MTISNLEDEVMELRDELQVMNKLQLETQRKLDAVHEAKDRVSAELADVTNHLCEMERDRDGWRVAAEAQSEANNTLNSENKLLASDRDFWRREAEMWHKECRQRSGGYF